MRFLDWLKIKEDGDGGDCGGGDFTSTVDSGTFTRTTDIAPYIRPLFYNYSRSQHKKRKKHKKHKTLKEYIQSRKDEYNVKNDLENIINTIIDEGKFVMYFLYEGDLFGTTDDQRSVYANIMNPQDSIPYKDSFSATNISAWLESNQAFNKVFYKKDTKQIKIMTKEEVKKTLNSITRVKNEDNNH